MTYQPKTYRDEGGNRQVVASGGEINIKNGGKITDDGTQASAITDISDTADGTYSSNEQTMLNNLKAQLNSALAALRGAGIIAS